MNGTVEMKKMFVVGDKFKCFITNDNIIGISKLNDMVDSSDDECEFDAYNIFIGQGVCEIQMKRIYDLVQLKGLEEKFKIHLPDYYQKSSKCLTHKRRYENIMISEPIDLGESIYKCHLMLNDNCAEMSDHVTGHHIQGMVVIEAARQMVLAVTEKFLISDKRNGSPNFLTNSIGVEFKKFIFPLQVQMLAVLTNVKKAAGNNLICNFSISFIQNGDECVTLTCNSSVLDSDYIAEKEAYLAAECIKSHFNLELA